MRDDLLAYLLGALDPDDHQRVEEYLKAEPDAARDLAALRRAVAPLEGDGGHFPPPPDLCYRTCRRVNAEAEASRPKAVAAATAPDAGQWRLRDVLVAAAVCCGALLLIIPAVRLSRANDRIARCADNLRQLGVAFHTYSEQFGHLPYVAADGPLSFAGVFSPSLYDAGLLEDGSLLVCPGDSSQQRVRLAGTEELLEASRNGAAFAELRAQMGGAYAYALGYMEDDRYLPIIDRRRPHFAILGDRPPPACGPEDNSLNHGGCGQNVLYEDGHVEWVRTCRQAVISDHLYLNHKGEIGPGDGPEDAVLARSEVAPF